jgi:hypothetical protein
LSTCTATNDEVENVTIIPNQLEYEQQGQTSFTIPSPPTHTIPAKKNKVPLRPDKIVACTLQQENLHV